MHNTVYKLEFRNTEKIYVGRSNNFIKRISSHISAMKGGYSTKKLQQAYDIYGVPTASILQDNISDTEIYNVEKSFILSLDTINNGFNTSSDTKQGGGGKGELSSWAKYSNSSIEELIYFIVNNPHISLVKVGELLDIDYSTVEGVAYGKTYTWMQTDLPELYVELMLLKGSRKDNLSAGSILLSPAGIVYQFNNTREFCRQQDLNQSAISKVLRGVHKQHRGWKVP